MLRFSFEQQTLIPGGDQELVVPEAAGAGVSFEIIFAEGFGVLDVGDVEEFYTLIGAAGEGQLFAVGAGAAAEVVAGDRDGGQLTDFALVAGVEQLQLAVLDEQQFVAPQTDAVGKAITPLVGRVALVNGFRAGDVVPGRSAAVPVGDQVTAPQQFGDQLIAVEQADLGILQDHTRVGRILEVGDLHGRAAPVV